MPEFVGENLEEGKREKSHLKILHVTTFGEFAKLGTFPAEKSVGGGVGMTLISCVNYAHENQLYESHVVCVIECAFIELARKYGIDVQVVNSFWVKFLGRPIVIWLSIRELKKIIEEKKIDVVHAYNFAAGLSGGIAAKLCHVPMVICVHQDISDYISGQKNVFVKFLSWLRKSIILSLWRWGSVPLARKILPVSRFVASTVEKIGVAKKKIEVVYNGIDARKSVQENHEARKLRNEFGVRDDDFLIGSIGRLDPIKGYKTLILAAEILIKDFPHSKFMILGDGMQYDEFRELIRDKNLDKHFFLAGYRTNIMELYSAFNLFTLTSLVEGMPLVILEAMFNKIPVVASSVGGLPEVVIDGKTGLLVPAQNPEALALAFGRLIKDKGLISYLTDNAYRKVLESFTLENKVKRLSEIYHEVKMLS